ncbi:MAG: Transcriptional regulator, family [Actinomycetia bacterium]|nr:Transcriptional regulator, family [Actinomycetes bacterium]
MPRPLKQLNPYASWTRLFGATLRQLRLKAPDGESLTQADLGRLIAYSGATVSAVERGTLRPEEAFVEACERELNAGGVLRAFLPFVNTEWAEQRNGSGASHHPHLLSPAEVASDPVAFRDPTYLENLPDHTLEAKALALRAGASDTSEGVVETVQLQVDRYCRDYPTVSPALLEPRVRQRLRELHELLDGRLTLRQRRELLAAGGFLTLLLSCLQFDMGHSEAAEESRDAAYQLGQAAEHQEIIAWTYEISAWFALVDRRYDDTVEHARAGLQVAPHTSAGVQLAVQAAKGWSRMGNAEQAELALQRGAISLASLSTPSHPEHHFVFDAAKLSFYAATCWAWLERPDRAREHAEAVVAQCLAVPGRERWPVRLAETRVDLGLMAVQEGELEAARHLGELALGSHRKAGSTLGRVRELDEAVMAAFPDAPEARDFHDRFVTARRSLELGTPG